MMLFDAIFRQGLARPRNGIRAILDPLCKKLKELGVERRMNTAVKRLHSKNNKIEEIELESGESIFADQIISTCGVVETELILGNDYASNEHPEVGDFSVIESISVIEGKPTDYGWDETVIFFNDSEKFHYQCPEDYVDLRSGVICLPQNYQLNSDCLEFKLRITHPANFSKWEGLTEKSYLSEKEHFQDKILQNGLE